eukprot:gene7690-biopygen14304
MRIDEAPSSRCQVQSSQFWLTQKRRGASGWSSRREAWRRKIPGQNAGEKTFKVLETFPQEKIEQKARTNIVVVLVV